MQVTRENLLSFKRIFLAFTLILLIGNSAQGAPLTKARYQRLRCHPDSKAANCIEEAGPLFDYVPGAASKIQAPRASPYLLNKHQEEFDSSLFGEQELGSGVEVTSGAELEAGSGIVNDPDYYDIILNQIASGSE
uniref:Serglycin n=1 Tax=Geotrypetes seraphini TaxID=260995 RepID=A0A6P8QU72_GEOSA|nr:serglycin [Geotrypetes seraphini]